MQTYSAQRDQNQEQLRRTVVAAAERVLLEHSAEAVTVRRIAQQLDCSTTVIYNLFGSKDGLANALYQEGCRLLQASLSAVVPHEDPHQYLRELGWAFWGFAHQHRQYFLLMFGGALPQFKPDPASIQDVATAIGLLVAVLEGYRMAGTLKIDDSAATATMLWAALHGVIHLSFAGHLHDAQTARAIYARTIDTLIDALARS
ncbi:TetR/AcrR family transcriptional regulator [Candidatus Gracilibacteria bacterium]|nr:TetR/AcrR family transcriptional regulator [Candidatus Gracilibacteria bacterium]